MTRSQDQWEQLLGPQGRLLRLPGVEIWAIFEVLGGLVTHSSCQVKPST